jgi:hypothetical protein
MVQCTRNRWSHWMLEPAGRLNILDSLYLWMNGARGVVGMPFSRQVLIHSLAPEHIQRVQAQLYQLQFPAEWRQQLIQLDERRQFFLSQPLQPLLLLRLQLLPQQFQLEFLRHQGLHSWHLLLLPLAQRLHPRVQLKLLFLLKQCLLPRKQLPP